MLPPHGLRPVEVLHRGDILQPRGAAVPGALSCVPARARFKLAIPTTKAHAARRWPIGSAIRSNPLTWRSIVNRVWQYHFGRGLVDTPNDFGRMGALPTHPALLDWLAVQFPRSWPVDQTVEPLDRHQRRVSPIVADRRHRRAQAATAIAADADNRFLWRMNRQRLDAECVRDAVLAISGRLDLRMGGPSDRQFELQPGMHVTPIVDYSKFNLDSDAGRRRSVYRFLFRTLPDPFMETLDCPSGDEITPQRTSSVTVQQALRPVERRVYRPALRVSGGSACKRWARRLAHEWKPPCCSCSAGRCCPTKSADLTAYADKHGLANLCRVLFNANEFLVRELRCLHVANARRATNSWIAGIARRDFLRTLGGGFGAVRAGESAWGRPALWPMCRGRSGTAGCIFRPRRSGSFSCS